MTLRMDLAEEDAIIAWVLGDGEEGNPLLVLAERPRRTHTYYEVYTVDADGHKSNVALHDTLKSALRDFASCVPDNV